MDTMDSIADFYSESPNSGLPKQPKVHAGALFLLLGFEGFVRNID